MIVFVFLSIVFWISLAALFWTYFGYPLLMYFRSKVAPKPIRKDPDLRPSITMLIPAYNEADVIRRKLENTVSNCTASR